MIDGGRDYIIHNVFGAYWYQSQLKTFLLNYSLKPVTMWMSRHGQSAWNSEQRIGGNPGLSAHGKRYARALAKFGIVYLLFLLIIELKLFFPTYFS